MDFLFTPWRYAYVTGTHKATRCLFCELTQAGNDEKALIVHRDKHCFVILNAYPYTSGHVMVVPYQHTDQLQLLPAPAAQEAAGAGVEGHIHMHVLPRWVADANFMSVIGETRVVPEDLATTYERIKAKF